MKEGNCKSGTCDYCGVKHTVIYEVTKNDKAWACWQCWEIVEEGNIDEVHWHYKYKGVE